VSFDKSKKELFLIGELAGSAGVSTDTVRHYERNGVISKPRRAANGYRLYRSDALEQIILVRRAIAVGFTLKELAEIFAERYKGNPPCRKVRAIAARKLADLENHLREVKILYAELSKTIADWDEQLANQSDENPVKLLESLVVSPTNNQRRKSKFTTKNLQVNNKINNKTEVK
jgi:DNA-binding transcriptional MerR regulator